MDSFYLKVCSIEIIKNAFKIGARKNRMAGADGITWREVSNKSDQYLISLSEDLVSCCYKPSPPQKMEKHYSHDPNKILYFDRLTVRDRIVEYAIKLVLSPLYEEYALPFVCSFRPGKGEKFFSNQVIQALEEKYYWFVCADIEKYFYSIDISILKKQLLTLTNDEKFVNLIFKCMFIEESDIGIPLGHVISPLISNIFLHPIDYSLRKTKILRYGDNYFFLNMVNSKGDNEIGMLQSLLTKINLKLNHKKTKVMYKPDAYDLIYEI